MHVSINREHITVKASFDEMASITNAINTAIIAFESAGAESKVNSEMASELKRLLHELRNPEVEKGGR